MSLLRRLIRRHVVDELVGAVLYGGPADGERVQVWSTQTVYKVRVLGCEPCSEEGLIGTYAIAPGGHGRFEWEGWTDEVPL